jgi:hypothetical protein
VRLAAWRDYLNGAFEHLLSHVRVRIVMEQAII